MDPSQDPPEEPARPDEQRDPVTDPTQPVLFWDVQLSQKDVQNWTKKGAFRHFYMNWYLLPFFYMSTCPNRY